MRLGWRGAVGLTISAVLVVYLFLKIPWRDVGEQIRHANYLLLAAAAVTATAMFPLRARRWRTILDPVAPRLPFGPLWRATAIGMMVNNTVPARAGELARAYVLSREVPAVPFSTALASLVVDRVFDGVVVLLLLVASLFMPGAPSGATIQGVSVAHFALLFAGISAIAFLGLYGLVFFPMPLIRLFELVARRVSPTIKARGRDALIKFAEGLSVLRAPAHFIAVFWWTLLHWLVQPVAFYLGFRAVGINVPISAALFVQGVIVVGVSLPSSPGFWGPFEVAAVASLSLYGVSQAAAVTWAIAFHVVSFIPITVIGAVYFARLGLSFDELGSAGKDGGAAVA